MKITQTKTPAGGAETQRRTPFAQQLAFHATNVERKITTRVCPLQKQNNSRRTAIDDFTNATAETIQIRRTFEISKINEISVPAAKTNLNEN